MTQISNDLKGQGNSFSGGDSIIHYLAESQEREPVALFEKGWTVKQTVIRINNNSSSLCCDLQVFQTLSEPVTHVNFRTTLWGC